MHLQSELAQLLSDVKEQILYLQELGVSDLNVSMAAIADSRPRTSNFTPEILDPRSQSPDPKPLEKYVPVEALKVPLKSVRKDAESSRLSALPTLGSRMSAPAAESRTVNNEPVKIEMPIAKTGNIESETLLGDVSPTMQSDVETIEEIRADIGNCTRCPLHLERTQVVHTTGNFQADLMFVGEAPGADEDAKGEPFVGRAGQLLTKIIEGMGMKREDVVIGNINRCRPPANRQPTLPEAETCRPFLLREIAVIRPKVIVVMGNTALHNLLETKVGITKMRGEFHDYFGVKVMPTFHPAYLLRDPRKKREVWEDMKKVRDLLLS